MKPGCGTCILRDNELVASTSRADGLFYLKIVDLIISDYAIAAARSKSIPITPMEPVEIWYRKLVYFNKSDIRDLEKMATGIKVDPMSVLRTCGNCIAGKQTRQLSQKSGKRAKESSELVDSDLCSQITPTSIENANYAGFFIDDATRWTVAVPLKGSPQKSSWPDSRNIWHKWSLRRIIGLNDSGQMVEVNTKRYLTVISRSIELFIR